MKSSLHPVLEIIYGFKTISSSIYIATSQYLNQYLFGIMTIFGIHIEFLNTCQQEGKKKDSCINDKVLLNTAQKTRFNSSSLQQSIIGKPDIIRHLKGPWYTYSYCKDCQGFFLGLTKHSDSHDLNWPNLIHLEGY